MAKKQGIGDTSMNNTRSFIKGLNKDSDPSFVQEGMWVHARNAVNNTSEGNLGTLSNEESNALCAAVAKDLTNVDPVIIGVIPLFSGNWIIYTAIYNNAGVVNSTVINSEIGLFQEEDCSYRPIVRDKCLNFNKFNLISGASREKEDCSWQVYWADGLNPDRYLNIGDPKLWPKKLEYFWNGDNYYINIFGNKILWPGVAWVEDCVDPLPGAPDPDCKICKQDNSLDCDAIRLATLVKTPCIDIKAGTQQGVIENGSYAVAVAYVINRQRVTNYFSLTYIQPLWQEINERNSLELTIDADTEHFDELELVVVRFINQNGNIRRVGYFSTSQETIVLDQIAESLPGVSENEIFAQNPVFETSDQITEAGRYLLRIGPTSKFDFNYQPLANLIRAEWVAVEHAETYYRDGGKNVGYLRDEVYSFFIRWVYDTGDKSSSYHIPGRPPKQYQGVYENLPYNDPINSLPGDNLLFETVNTATGSSITPIDINDGYGGKIVAKGEMGYWESSLEYPDNRSDIWNSSQYCWTGNDGTQFNTDLNTYENDLCGKPIRHHRFPDNQVIPHFRRDAAGKCYIRTLGVRFKNIILPKDNDGNDITNIVGYEILRGSRHGNKSIIAKGMINNFRDYQPQGEPVSTSLTAVYANYPFNCIVPPENQFLNSGLSGYNYFYNDPFILNKRPKATLNPFDLEKINQKNILDLFSFHSPDTSFKNPYLSTTEVKVYGQLRGTAEQRFIEPLGHPRFKLLLNNAAYIGFLGGLINWILKTVGEVKINYPAGKFEPQLASILLNGGTTLPIPTGYQLNTVGEASAFAIQNGFNTSLDGYFLSGAVITDALGITNTLQNTFEIAGTGMGSSTGYYTLPTYEKTYTGFGVLPPWLGVGGNIGASLFYFWEGMQETTRLLYAFAPYRQFALEQIGHGDYNIFTNPNEPTNRTRYVMADGIYVYDSIQEYPEFQNSTGQSVRYRIHNLKRPKIPVLRLETNVGNNTGPGYIKTSPGSNYSYDNSLVTLKDAVSLYKTNTGVDYDQEGKLVSFKSNIASYYVGLKYSIKNQYGQLANIQQIVCTPCEQRIDFDNLSSSSYTACDIPNFIFNKIAETSVFFGGDTYINRFTEKNIMPLFFDWLYDQPDGYEYNYALSPMIPFPRFFVNSEPWDYTDFNFTNIIGLIGGTNPGSGAFPNSYFKLDNTNFNKPTNLTPNYPGLLYPKNSYFYTSINGVRDFFVESEVLVDFRARGTFNYEQHYDKYRYTNLEDLFSQDPQILTRGNTYNYDYSLSASRFVFNQYYTQGVLQGANYDPTVAELCYTYYPNRIQYSLPQQSENTPDGWLTYLPFNRVDFKNNVNSVKSFAKTGMLITFEDATPLYYQGVDQLQLGSGTAITIGDGALFSRDPQQSSNAEKTYEYGSAQDRLGVIATPVGIYFISQNQGKIFAYGEGLQEISQASMKWWFDEFLPYKLIEDFPDFPYVDNPVAGIGCSASYDNSNSILYFSKKDYKLKDEYKGKIQYVERDIFYYDEFRLSFKLGDSRFFEPASWTISYDPKNQMWISFHDWHPELYMPGKSGVHTTKEAGIWKHNAGCNDYCNFYGIQYPFEVELPVITGQNVTTMKSIEYILECYRRDNRYCVDQFHVLDYNFDKLVVYNTEQVSGYLNLNAYPKNNVPLSLTYPIVNPNSVDILFSKEENKYRINQFWDITKDRGEFPQNSTYPPLDPLIPGTTTLLGTYSQEQIWNTEANGYIKNLNQANLNYNKNQLQRKKFRHYLNFINLSKQNSRNTNMILKFINTKNQYSPR